MFAVWNNGLAGLGELPSGPLSKGTVVYWQGNVEAALGYVYQMQSVSDAIKKAVEGTGVFDWVQVTITGTFDPYVRILARPKFDRADAMDPQSQIIQALNSITGDFSVLTGYQIDPNYGYGIYSQPSGTPPTVGQSTAPPGLITSGNYNTGPNGPGVLDQLTSALGLDAKFGFAAGLGLALLGVILIGKLVK